MTTVYLCGRSHPIAGLQMDGKVGGCLRVVQCALSGIESKNIFVATYSSSVCSRRSSPVGIFTTYSYVPAKCY